MNKQLKREMEKVDLMPSDMKGVSVDFHDYLMNTENLGERRIMFHIIDKRRIKGIPPRVEYTLTERGKEIVTLLRPLIFWAAETTGHRECQIVDHFL